MFDRLLPHIKGNVGFVFTKEDLAEVRDMLLENKVRGHKRNVQCGIGHLLVVVVNLN